MIVFPIFCQDFGFMTAVKIARRDLGITCLVIMTWLLRPSFVKLARLKLMLHFPFRTKISDSETAVKIARRDLGVPSLVIMTHDFT